MNQDPRTPSHSPSTWDCGRSTRAYLFHSTEWGPEILRDNAIQGNSTINPDVRLEKASDLRWGEQHHGLQGVCVTRSFYFARQFSDTIFVLDRRIIQYRHRILLRAEKDAYDLANNHGDFRIEAEEFIICKKLSLATCLAAIWVRQDHAGDPDHRELISHSSFKGYFTQP